MEVGGVGHPEECPEAGAHMPPGVEVKALQWRVRAGSGANCQPRATQLHITASHLKHVASVVVEQPQRYAGNVSADGKLN